MSDNSVQGGSPPADVPVYISSSPHIGSPVDTGQLMSRVILALTPVSIFGIVLYGVPALFTILVSVTAAELAELLFRKIIRKDIRNGDLSAVVTGLLLALILPPSTPLWITALGSIFAIVVAKEFFGGLGANVFNPALAGRAFLLMSFPVAITTWTLPKIFLGADIFVAPVDIVSGPTTLGAIKLGDAITGAGIGPAVVSFGTGSHFWINFGNYLLGFRGGSIGESSIILIVAGFVFLLATGTIDWRAPVSMVLSVFVFSFLFGKDPLFAILSGGALFGAVFMTTDYVTAPFTSIGKLVFGFFAGLITVIIRRWGNFPEGVTYSILIMNAFTPFLNRLLQKKYGYVKPQKAKVPKETAAVTGDSAAGGTVGGTAGGTK